MKLAFLSALSSSNVNACGFAATAFPSAAFFGAGAAATGCFFSSSTSFLAPLAAALESLLLN
jgi:hypothetical protein